jgi:SAM-dependent methyltransferase
LKSSFLKSSLPPDQLKYLIYEHSVQSPQWQVDYLPQFHVALTGKKPFRMREDFSGTGKIATEWVKRSSKNIAVGLDFDTEVLRYAKTVNQASLTAQQQKRVQFYQRDVRQGSRATDVVKKFDWIGAFNFSYFVFHERAELLDYAKSIYRSLDDIGTVFFEIAGGPGFLKSTEESKMVGVPGVGKVKQVWEQHHYDPITSVCDYSIHFQLPKKFGPAAWIPNAFNYHWRVWQIRELREILAEAGFVQSQVLWESKDSKGCGMGEFLPTDFAENEESWLAYVVGLKKSKRSFSIKK